MTGPAPVIYSPQAAQTLDGLEADPGSVDLWNALCDALDLIIDHPDSAPARRTALKTTAGTTVWHVSVRVPREADDWAILWHQDDTGQILIAYIGTL